MITHSTTVIVLLVSVAGLLGYDLYALYRGGIQVTLSRVIIEGSKTYPIIPLLFGILIGHLFT